MWRTYLGRGLIALALALVAVVLGLTQPMPAGAQGPSTTTPDLADLGVGVEEPESPVDCPAGTFYEPPLLSAPARCATPDEHFTDLGIDLDEQTTDDVPWWEGALVVGRAGLAIVVVGAAVVRRLVS